LDIYNIVAMIDLVKGHDIYFTSSSAIAC